MKGWKEFDSLAFEALRSWKETIYWLASILVALFSLFSLKRLLSTSWWSKISLHAWYSVSLYSDLIFDFWTPELIVSFVIRVVLWLCDFILKLTSFSSNIVLLLFFSSKSTLFCLKSINWPCEFSCALSMWLVPEIGKLGDSVSLYMEFWSS